MGLTQDEPLLEPEPGSLWPIGEMRGLSDVLGRVNLSWIDVNLRGASQVVFMNNPVSGLFILLGLAIFNWKTALYGVCSLVSGTTAAMALHKQGHEGFASLTDGLYGFNAILVGLGIGTFSDNAKSDDLGDAAQTLVLCIVFGVLSSVVMNSMAKWMPTPAFTLPFNITIMWFFAGTLAYSSLSTDMSPKLPVRDAIRTCLRSSATGDCDMQNLYGFVVASLQGVCEIFLAGSNISALLILAGMALCSPWASLCCVLGSVVGLVTGMALGVDGFSLYQGMCGFNPALTMVAIGGGIFEKASLRAFIWAIFGAVVTTFMNGAIGAALRPCGLPAFTLPFCLATVFHFGAGLYK